MNKFLKSIYGGSGSNNGWTYKPTKEEIIQEEIIQEKSQKTGSSFEKLQINIL